MMRSLRSRVVGGMGLLIGLVFVIALLGVNAIRALDQSVERELSLLMETTDLGNGLIASVAAEVRSAEQYLVRPADKLRLEVLEQGDSAYAFQRRYRGLGSLTTSDRYIVNQIADNQDDVRRDQSDDAPLRAGRAVEKARLVGVHPVAIPELGDLCDSSHAASIREQRKRAAGQIPAARNDSCRSRST